MRIPRNRTGNRLKPVNKLARGKNGPKAKTARAKARGVRDKSRLKDRAKRGRGSNRLKDKANKVKVKRVRAKDNNRVKDKARELTIAFSREGRRATSASMTSKEDVKKHTPSGRSRDVF